jgi:hypothetical protein
MATVTGSFFWLPENLPEEIAGDDGVLQIPPGIQTLAGFRRWMHSDEFPEKLKAHFIQGNIYLDMSQEAIQTHVLVKKAVYQKLPNLIDDEYWLIDARGEEILFHILQWRQSGYVAAAVKEGWQHSRVFDHDFQLVRARNRRGAWHYQLLVKP